MAQIRPFMAYRPCQGMEKRIAALPYDVYNREEACEVVKKNPDSFLAVDRAETQFGEEVDTYADCVYENCLLYTSGDTQPKQCGTRRHRLFQRLAAP